MAKLTRDTSPPSKGGKDQSKSPMKKYAKEGKEGRTDPQRLLTEKNAISLRKDRMEWFVKKASDSVDRHDHGSSKLSKSERWVADAMLGNLPRKAGIIPVASNPVSRVIFFDAMYRQLKALHAEPGLRMYFITIVDAKWCLPRNATSFDTLSMMRRAKRALRDIDYDGILILEIQAVIGLPDIRFMPHMHGIIWRRGGKGMGPVEAVQLLNKRFAGIENAKGVQIEIMPQKHPDSLPTRFHYATKLPDQVSANCPATGDNDASVKRSERKSVLKRGADRNYTKTDALRIAGMLGQHQVDSTVFAFGEGTKVRKAASKVLAAEMMSKRGRRDSPTPKEVLAVITKLLP